MSKGVREKIDNLIKDYTGEVGITSMDGEQYMEYIFKTDAEGNSFVDKLESLIQTSNEAYLDEFVEWLLE